MDGRLSTAAAIGLFPGGAEMLTAPALGTMVGAPGAVGSDRLKRKDADA